MSDHPESTSQGNSQPRPSGSTGAGRGWYVPPDASANLENVPSEPDGAPLPTNQSPERTGGWYVPADAAANVIEPPAPEPQPTSAEPAAVTPETPPNVAIQPDAPGAASSDQIDYNNYVPGVGVVPEGSAQPTVPEATPAATSSASTIPPLAALTPTAPPPPPTPAETTATPALYNIENIAAPPETEPLTQRFDEVEQEVQILRRRYTAGLMSADDLRADLRKLMILDTTGHWWMIGMETDRWYQYDGKDWLLGTPPGRTPSLPTATAPLIPTSSPASTVPLGTTGLPPSLTTPMADGDPNANVPTMTVTIPLDEYGMPLPPTQGQGVGTGQGLPRAVPVDDPNATIVAHATPYLDDTLRSGATVPVAIPGSEATVVAAPQPYQAADAYPQTYAPADAQQPVEDQYSNEPLQPDYGERPGGIITNRARLTNYLVSAAVIVFVIVMAASLLVIIGSVATYYSIVNQYDAAITALPQKANSTFKTVQILDSKGNVIANVTDPNGGNRKLVTIDQISPFLLHATVSTEDARFYTNTGFDIVSIARAALQNIFAGQVVSGASTITQQLSRLLVFDPTSINSPTQRKLTELVVASEISRRYPKDQILDIYLNQIPYGNFSYGIEAAAETYFGIPAKNLNLAQASLLAGLPQSPATYDPIQNRQAAFARMQAVQGLMVQTGCLPIPDPDNGNQQPLCITQARMNASATDIAMVETATFKPPSNNYTHPHFVNYVLQQLEATYGDAIYNTGFTVTTTLDPNLQTVAEQSVAQQVALLASRHVTNGAVLVIRPNDGAVLAMVGSADFRNASISGQVNMVLAPRQPGSSLKPFIYLTSFEPDATGAYWTPATVLWDVPGSCFNVSTPPYCPTNYDSTFHGPVTVRTALANSYNVPAVKALNYVTLDRFSTVADQVGLKFPLKPLNQAGLTAALGSDEIRMTDLVRAYATLANQGKRLEDLYAISKITTANSDGTPNVVYDSAAHPVTLSQVADPGLTYLVTSILSDNNARLPAFGAGNPLQLANGQPAAVKTGTTSDFRDNWTVGYTPSVVVGTWVGNADNSPMAGVEGVTGAGPIWNQVMTAAMSGQNIQPFPAPSTVGQATICTDFGTLDFTGCQHRAAEVFVSAEPPPTIDKVLTQAQVDQFTGFVANQYCPNFVTTETFLTINDSAALNWLNTNATGQRWAQSRSLTLPIVPPPTQACDQNTPNPIIRVNSPQANQTVSGLIQIQGTVTITGFSYYQLELASASNQSAVAKLGDPVRDPKPVDGSFLGGWETHNVPDGQYVLRVHLFDTQGRSVTSAWIPVIVNNTNPPQTPPPFNSTPFGATLIPGFPTLPPIQPAISPTPIPFGPPTSRPLFPTSPPQ